MIVHERAIRRVPAIAAGVVASIGLLVLAGWTFNIELLKSLLHPNRVAMNPLTATAFILAAAAVWLLSGRRNLMARAFAAAVVVAGALRLFEYATGLNVSVDRILFTSRLNDNEMAPNTAACFVLIGAGLLLIDWKFRRVHPAQFLVLTAAAVAILSATGYIYQSISLYRFRSYIPMALNTSIAFIVLSVGIIALRPRREPINTAVSDTLGGVVARRLIPAAFLVPLLVGWLRLQGQRIGLYDNEFGVALFVLAVMLIFNLLIWWCARVMMVADLRLRARHRELEETHAELQNAQSALVQSEKLAGLGQMVAGVAHEINNPLSFVANNLSVLRRDVAAICDLLSLYGQCDHVIAEHRLEIASEIRERAQRMDLAYTTKSVSDVLDRSREGLRRIQQIVKDLRDFARLDQSDLQEADINAGIESTINIIRGRAKTKQVTIDFKPGALPVCACYPAKLNQVVMNLLANAIDACNEGGNVTIATSRDGDHVKIEVTDTGPGVDPAIRHRIFDPFFTTKPMGQGTGLGLSISYGIVHDHGGTIEVDAASGGGAKFTVTLPDRSRAASAS